MMAHTRYPVQASGFIASIIIAQQTRSHDIPRKRFGNKLVIFSVCPNRFRVNNTYSPRGTRMRNCHCLICHQTALDRNAA